MRRAEQFALLAIGRPEYQAKACEAAVKACAAYPLSAFLFDCATILRQFAKTSEARTLIAEFLRRPEAGPVRDVDEITRGQRDIADMVAQAEAALASR